MLQRILKGELPTSIFKQMMMSNTGLTNRQLAQLFYEEFPEIDGVAVQYIWHWKSPSKPTGDLADEVLDDVLRDLLSKAGYLVK